MRFYPLGIGSICGSLFLFGCSSNDASNAEAMGGSVSSSGGAKAETTAGGTNATGGATNRNNLGGMTAMGGMSGPTHFKLRIENTSTNSPLPTPFAPGVYAVVNGPARPFTSDAAASMGLEMATEDGNPSKLGTEILDTANLAVSGIFNTPVGASMPGPIKPGDAYELTFDAMPGQTLHLESMFGQSNATYLSTASGIGLFDSQGKPQSYDVTSQISLWDSGTERNEAPLMGPNQAPRQATPNTGPTETSVSLRTDGTRAIPIPSALLDVSVSLASGSYTITLNNKSNHGPLMSPLSPVFYALHGPAYHYFTVGGMATTGLERLAEDGNPSVLVTEANAAGAMAAVAGTAAFAPGASLQFSVTPTSTMPVLSLAMMIGQSNDAFVGTRPQGILLLDASGMPRMPSDVQADIQNLLATWDAGTEANEVPGVGPNQAPRQPTANTGPVDPNSQIRLYADSTNDLAHLSNLLNIGVVHGTGSNFDVTVSNTSGAGAFPLVISPVAWALHDDVTNTFALASPASPGLEHLAEDGASATLLTEWSAMASVASSGVAGSGPFASGNAVSFKVTPDAQHRFLSVEAMLVPSNDTFLALGPMGIALLDATGNPRNDSDIAADIIANLAAYESGTEANQGSALGPDMAPYQSGPNQGANEGSGKMRPIDGVWPFPPVSTIVKATLTAQ